MRIYGINKKPQIGDACPCCDGRGNDPARRRMQRHRARQAAKQDIEAQEAVWEREKETFCPGLEGNCHGCEWCIQTDSP